MTSRRELYAHGEPFGDSATRRKIDGKGYVCGFGGDSSSSTSYTQNMVDRRITQKDGFAVAGDANAITMNTTNVSNVLDGGAIAKAFGFSTDTTKRAFDSVDTANATLGAGYESLIEASKDIFNQGQNLIGQTQKAVADAYGQAQADKGGTIDNRTLIALAAAGAVAAVIIARK